MSNGTRILVAYGSKRGSTKEVAEAIAATLREDGHDVTCEPAESAPEPGRFGAVVVGGGIYAGRWHRDARHFVKRHREALARMPLAVFGMGPSTLEEEEVAKSRAQLDAALAKLPVSPELVAVFGGVVDPATFPFPLNRMPASDARDWDAIRTWAHDVAALAGAPAPGAGTTQVP
jgi:menaquinone-dependent protoporphyrinogen oxidase